MSTPADWAETTEAAVLDAALIQAPRTGWSTQTLAEAGRAVGLSAADLDLLMPGGAQDLAALLSRRHDQAMLAVLARIDPHALKMRDRILCAVEARLEAALHDEAATRRWAGFLALPPNIPLALRLTWDSADLAWRWAGDVSADANHYSKRAILASILVPALAVRLADGREAADAYVRRRIDRVMAFEKWKAGWPKADLGAQLAGALGRLRFGKG